MARADRGPSISTAMSTRTLELLITRELRAVRREIEAYPDDASVWREIPGLPNAGGTLALHVAGNIRHFIDRRA